MSVYRDGADREELKLPTSSLKPLHPALVIATLLQHPTVLNTNRLPDLQGGSSWSWQQAEV